MSETLFKKQEEDTIYQPLGKGLSVRKENSFVEVWRNGGFLFRKDLDPREYSPDFRMLIVDLATCYNAQKGKLTSVFSVSRQTIDNWILSYEADGILGLINSTKNIGNTNRSKGNKARMHESAKRIEKMKNQKLQLSFDDVKFPDTQDIVEEDEPYQASLEQKTNRYAGVFSLMILLVSHYKWFNWVVGFFGKGYKIFQVFMLMAVMNIRSIEQLKNIRLKEAGAIIGITRIPSLPVVWSMFYETAKKNLSNILLNNFFAWQIKISAVSQRFWFTDGHVLPYTGRSKMHKVFNTKRRQPEPGCINFVTSDIEGKIVDFEIKEGGENLRDHIVELHHKWSGYFEGSEYPVYVFDREGDGCEFFYRLVQKQCPFITWEKNADQKKLNSLPESGFTEEIEINDTKYLYLEKQKKFTYEDENKEKHSFALRRFYVINTATRKRTAALAYNGNTELSRQDCIYGILNRWGASENTFKHMGDRQPMSYRPGFKLVESENQTIANPRIKELEKEIKSTEKEVQKKCRILAEKDKTMNKSGQVRKNDTYTRLKDELEELKSQIADLKQKKSELPERIDVSSLENYDSFKVHDNEGKNLFDFAGSLVWNARKKGVALLSQLYPYKNDVVDLFYAIINCHGSVKINEKEIRVTLEPLQQSSRRAAQIDFCRKLTELGAKTPGKKSMIIEVART
jgi:hypothetical protein